MGGEAGEVEGVWRWVTGQLSYSVTAGVGGALMALVRSRWGRGGAREGFAWSKYLACEACPERAHLHHA